jgi:hypothetical protein
MVQDIVLLAIYHETMDTNLLENFSRMFTVILSTATHTRKSETVLQCVAG